MTQVHMTHVLSTHRLQFHHAFTFADAERQVDYFAALGVSHLYASPITTSQPGSTHGYDTVDYTRVNPELGGEEGLRSLVAALRRRGMGLIIDIVPNHMGVGGADNAWWNDILEWGRHAAHARHFDIDWHSPDPALRGKVLAPFLGEAFGEALAGGKITLECDARDGRIYASYYAHRFPICPVDYAKILTDAPSAELQRLAEAFAGLGHQPEDQVRAEGAREALAAFVSEPGGEAAMRSALSPFAPDTAEGQHALQRLLDRQHFRLAWWRSASDEVNWRRFFDISSLAGVRVERSEVFDASHALVLRLYAEGLVDGLRIDHVDGLAEPREYCVRLRGRLEAAHAQRPASLRQAPPYLVIEKILGRGEAMRDDWKVDGTTGYDFMNDVGALLHDAEGAAPLAQLWHQTSGRPAAFIEEALPARRKVLAENLAAELDRTTRALHRIARDTPSTRDYSFIAIRRVLTELAVHYPVYRIYPVDGVRSAEDERYFSLAREGARAALRRADHALLDQIDAWLGAPTAITQDAIPRRIALTLFSQLTSPVAAKSVEDTACYRYGRLISRNEVGADPDDFALSTTDFHDINLARAQHFPHAMLTTATHDHKRGEDVRARIAVLSELPAQWGAIVRRWSSLNTPLSAAIDHADRADRADRVDHVEHAPGPGFESMLYQTLLGCWPADLAPDDAASIKTLSERVAAWQQKALREAKLDTDWFAPNEPYEQACEAFLSDILSPQRREGFLASLHEVVAAIAPAGVVNSLQQTLLRLTAPGVPDLYQGTEWWDLSLVDPDNRRPVDYVARARMLDATQTIKDARTLLTQWHDGGIKQHVIHRALALRNAAPALFLDGAYLPLEVVGVHARSILAFARHDGTAWSITVVTRLATRLLGVDAQLDALLDAPVNTPSDATAEIGQRGTRHASAASGASGHAVPHVSSEQWGDTRLLLPTALAGSTLHDRLAGKTPRVFAIEADRHAQGGEPATLSIASVLADLPVALLSTLD